MLTSKARSKGWIGANVDIHVEGEHKFQAAIGKVSQALAKALKPGRKIVSAVRFTDGKIEEVTEATFDTSVPDPKEIKVTKAARDPVNLQPALATAGASVAAPVRGCPAPDFVNAELKAAEVLSHFLDSDQFNDFQRYNRFISVGCETGHRYMITSRHARSELGVYHRSLYDLDENVPLCVHDWVVPAPEEMLSLHLLLQLPGWESYLRKDEHDMELLRLEYEALRN